MEQWRRVADGEARSTNCEVGSHPRVVVSLGARSFAGVNAVRARSFSPGARFPSRSPRFSSVVGGLRVRPVEGSELPKPRSVDDRT